MDISNAFSIILQNPYKIGIPIDSISNNLVRNIYIGLAEAVVEYAIGMYSEVQMNIAEEILKIRDKNIISGIRLYIVRDYSDEFIPWKEKDLKRYRKILRLSDGVFTVCNKPGRKTRDLCNEWMMQHTSGIIPIYTGDLEWYRNMIDFASDNNLGYISGINRY